MCMQGIASLAEEKLGTRTLSNAGTEEQGSQAYRTKGTASTSLLFALGAAVVVAAFLFMG